MRRPLALGWARRALAAVLVAAVAGCGSGTDGGSAGSADPPDGGTEQEDAAGWHGGILTEPQPRPSFTLTDTAGQPFDFPSRTAGRLTLLFFGYTSCPDICPIHMATLSLALDQPGMPRPAVVFVTTDPARDTPERLRSWLDEFGTDFIGLTGTPDQIRAAEEAAGLATSFAVDAEGRPVDTSAPPADYEVGHASQIIAYGPDDLAHIVYPSGVQRDDWEADLPRLEAGEIPTAGS